MTDRGLDALDPEAVSALVACLPTSRVGQPRDAAVALNLDLLRWLIRAGYTDEFDSHEGWHLGTRHMCHLASLTSGVPNAPSEVTPS